MVCKCKSRATFYAQRFMCGSSMHSEPLTRMRAPGQRKPYGKECDFLCCTAPTVSPSGTLVGMRTSTVLGLLSLIPASRTQRHQKSQPPLFHAPEQCKRYGKEAEQLFTPHHGLIVGRRLRRHPARAPGAGARCPDGSQQGTGLSGL